MIQTHDDLDAIRQRLALVEDALESLRNTVLSKNKTNYAVMSEGYIDMIRELRGEIETYLGLNDDESSLSEAESPSRRPA